MAPDTELEIKLMVPPQAQAAVRRAVATASARRLRLQAVYFDSADQHLAAAGIALRLRRQGRHWVQTLKAAQAHSALRLEHEVIRRGAAAMPELNLALHAGTAAGAALEAVLRTWLPDSSAAAASAAASAALQPQYRTDVQRWQRVLRLPGGSVELALDIGHIVAGAHELPLSELEIELLRGSMRTLANAARRWVVGHGLWLDVRSKSGRGTRLSQGQTAAAPAKAQALRLSSAMTASAAARATVANCLQQILPNASEIAAGVGSDEHLHQLRVGLRRLRTALRFFSDGGVALDAGWAISAAALFAQLGGVRDRTVIEQTLAPALLRAGAPSVALGPELDQADPVALLRRSEWSLFWLELMAWSMASDDDPALSNFTPANVPVNPASANVPVNPSSANASIEQTKDHAPLFSAPDHSPPAAAPPQHQPPAALRDMSAATLQRWQRPVLRDAKRFARLDEAARHGLRKRIKRLRYALEFCTGLIRPKRLSRWLAALEPAQDGLGRYNDVCVAIELYRRAAQDDPQAWFAVGWLSARRDAVAVECAAALKRLARHRPGKR